LYRYTDFTMNPWWDILTAEQQVQKKNREEQHQESGTKEDRVDEPSVADHTDGGQLRATLEQMCTDAADLLNQVFAEAAATAAAAISSSSSSAPTTTISSATTTIPDITALDIAQRIGACEQNAMGIRQRSPLCRNVFDLLLSGGNGEEEVDEDDHNNNNADGDGIHQILVQCLEEAGFIGGSDDDDDGEADEASKAEDEDLHDSPYHHHDERCGSGCNSKSAPSNEGIAEREEEGDDGDDTNGPELNYTSAEIARFIATLRIDEDGSVRDLAVPVPHHHNTSRSSDDDDGEDDGEDNGGGVVGDDLDVVFPPLDGTAMFSITCKMNHSCDPNIMVVYRRLPGWGRRFPLTAFSVATRDIAAGEELTISYIDANESYEERTKALRSYGFTCRCPRCIKEGGAMNKTNDDNGEDCQEPDDHADGNTAEKTNADNADELFDSDNESDNDDNDGAGLQGEDNARSEEGFAKLQQILSRLDTTANHSRFGLIPHKAFSAVSAFVLRTAKENAHDVRDNTAARATAPGDTRRWAGLLDQCVSALQLRDYCLAKIVGSDLESSIASAMTAHGGFANACDRGLYWCAALTAAIGLAYDYNFIEAQVLCDKAFTLGLCSPNDGYSPFFRYVEKFSLQMSQGPYSCFSVSDWRRRSGIEAEEENTAQTDSSSIPEISVPMSSIEFDVVLGSAEPAVFRNVASHWPAVKKWQNLSYLSAVGGHRLVPIELGSMLGGSMKETFMTLRQFVDEYLVPSNRHGYWSLEDSLRLATQVAYMAQHPLLDQITALRNDVMLFDFMSTSPEETMLWVGTGGTRTPLHFDSYDNLFVQVVGYKYVRLYAPDQTPKLYVLSGDGSASFSKQGNMSSLDCEREDFALHPLATEAVFTDVLLGPGDCLFIPAQTWHYVRSRTTSISVNFWI
jgi:hypothetical protein